MINKPVLFFKFFIIMRKTVLQENVDSINRLKFIQKFMSIISALVRISRFDIFTHYSEDL